MWPLKLWHNGSPALRPSAQTPWRLTSTNHRSVFLGPWTINCPPSSEEHSRKSQPKVHHRLYDTDTVSLFTFSASNMFFFFFTPLLLHLPFHLIVERVLNHHHIPTTDPLWITTSQKWSLASLPLEQTHFAAFDEPYCPVKTSFSYRSHFLQISFQDQPRQLGGVCF